MGGQAVDQVTAAGGYLGKGWVGPNQRVHDFAQRCPRGSDGWVADRRSCGGKEVHFDLLHEADITRPGPAITPVPVNFDLWMRIGTFHPILKPTHFKSANANRVPGSSTARVALLGGLVDLQNSFTVPADIDTAWKTLLDVESIAPCMPGATLESVNGDEFTASVKVKLGPVSMTYNGEARFLSKDEASHTAVIEGTGKETRGAGTAKALITTNLVAESPDRTRVDVTTALIITGKAAQFGRGVMQDVAGRIIDQFAGNLEQVIGARGEHAAAAASGDTSTIVTAPVIKAADSIDLLGTAGAPVLKRALPVIIGVIVAVAIVWWLIAR